MRKLIVILGIPIDGLDLSETLDRIETLITIGRVKRKSHQVATANTDFLVKALKDVQLSKILQQADICTPDGMPLVWAARLLGAPVPGRVAGADMVPALATRAAQKGFSVYFLGAEPGVAARAAEILQQHNPGLKIAGIDSPPFGPIENTQPEVLERIRAANPDVLLVAYGNPKQEKWIERFGPAINVPVMIGVGGSLDFIAGKTRRAPHWMQRSGLEWLYRLIQEPGRLWQRYAVDLVQFTRYFIRQWWHLRPSRAHLEKTQSALSRIEVQFTIDTTIITLPEQVTIKDRVSFQNAAKAALAASPHIIINMEATTFLDSSAIGTLVDLGKQARDSGGELWLAGVRSNILDMLRVLRLDTFFANGITISECLSERSTRFPSRRTPQAV
jgi:N-acetylglucosaminyldiphosphoundecaprenol N-acetyl-beta-D-mannosaminyltransferase